MFKRKKTSVLESQVEVYLVKQIEEAGGECWKWTSPARRGIPDRLVFMPGRVFEIVETKTIGGTLDPLQRAVHRMLQRVGFHVHIIWTYQQVDDFMAYLKTKK